MGQTAHVGQRATAGGGAVALLLLAGALVGCGSDGAKAVTTLTRAQDAVVVTASGRSVPAQPGQHLRRGDVLRTGHQGSATLNTGGRVAYLGGDGGYAVGSGVTGVLQRGALVVDARRGPAIALQAGTVSVDSGRSAVRIERSIAVRVGVLAGSADVRSNPAASGERIELPAYRQIVVAGRGLPTAGTPLVLTDDDAERRVVPDLVADDAVLNSTAASLDDGPEGRVILAGARDSGLDVRFGAASLSASSASATSSSATAARQPVSEAALPVALARAAAGATAAIDVVRTRYEQAVGFRSGGGSWAVVARLVGTDATGAGQAINALLAGSPAAGPVLAQGPNAPFGQGETTRGAPGNRSTSRQQPRGEGGGSPRTGGPGQTTKPNPGPSPSPGGAGDTVQDLVDDVVSVLPTPAAPKPAPTTNQSNCTVLGLINC